MIHRPHKEPGFDSKWQTGPQGPESYLMEFDLGAVRDFDCSLAFCFVMETIEKPIEKTRPKVRHVPADRAMCTRTKTGYQWTQCRSDGNLDLFESDICHEVAEPNILDLQSDNGSTDVSGVVREWECEGFDVVDEEEEISPEVLLKARMTQRAAQARREMSTGRSDTAEKSTEQSVDWSTVLIFLAIGSSRDCVC